MEKNEPLFTTEKFEGSPFQIIHEMENDKFFIVWKDMRLTPSFSYKQEAINYIEENKWTTMLLLVVQLIRSQKEMIRQIEELEQKELV